MRQQRTRLRLVLAGPVAAAAVALCCTKGGQTQVQLADLLRRADVQGLACFTPEDEDTDAQRSTILYEDFSAGVSSWKPTTAATVIRGAEDQQYGGALAVKSREGEDGAVGAYTVVSARPNTWYTVTWRVRAGTTAEAFPGTVRRPTVSVIVYETDPGEDSTAARRIVTGLPTVGHTVESRCHASERSEIGGDWTAGQMTFTTGATARGLAVVLAVGARGDDGEAEAHFTEVRVAEHHVTYETMLGSLKRKYADPSAVGSNPHGMLLRGPLASNVSGSTELGASNSLRDTRSAIFAPAPTTIRFPPVRVPAGAQLDVSMAVMREAWSASGDGVRFVVRVIGQGDTTVVAERHLEARARREDRGWISSRIDLRRWSGRRVRIELATLPGEDADYAYDLALWGNLLLWSPGRPVGGNLVILAVDTMRADRVGAYGCTRGLTPRIDRLARESCLFRNGATQSSWTLPAFASLVTSRGPESHGAGLRTYSGLPYPKSHLGVSQDELTLAEILRREGYVTQGFGVSATLYGTGFEQGFDGFLNDLDVESCVGGVVSARAIQWLQENWQKRFFLFLHYFDPHQPFNAPAPWDTLHFRRAYPYPRDARYWFFQSFIELAREGFLQGSRDDFVEMGRDLYDGEVAYVDHCLGLVIDELKRLGIYDRSIVVMMSDHGEEFWEHGACGHRTSLYETIQSVPVIIKPPKEWPLKRRVVEGGARLVDVMPTVLELLDVQRPMALEGRSLAGLMTGAVAEEPRRVFAQTDTHNDGMREVYSFRDADLKLVAYFHRRRPSYFREELYDLGLDPLETRNLAAAQADDLLRLRQGLASHIAERGWGWHIGFASPGDTCRFSGRVEAEGVIELVQPIEYWDHPCVVEFTADATAISFDCLGGGGRCCSGLLLRTSPPGAPLHLDMSRPMIGSADAGPAGRRISLRGSNGESVTLWRSGCIAGEVVAEGEERAALRAQLKALGYLDDD